VHNRIFIDIAYIVSVILFILGIKNLGSVKTARRGNLFASIGMFIAISVTLLDRGIVDFKLIAAGIIIGTIIGATLARTIQMTAMPQLVGMLNGFGGLASALVACSELLRNTPDIESFTLTTIVLGTVVGAVTFTGSVIAFGKLQGIINQNPITFPLQKIINLLIAIAIIASGIFFINGPDSLSLYWLIFALSSLIGILLVIPIGGADMPVVISLLNSYSGIAAAMTGFVLMNRVLIVAGALVGASGLILTRIMCKAMNRSLINVIFGGFGQQDVTKKEKVDMEYTGVKKL